LPETNIKLNKYLLPALLILTNFIFKGIYLAGNSLGGDEPFSVYVSQMNIPSLVSYLATGNNPPLYEMFLHYWIKCFGISEFAVRFPSLIFSCLTVFFLYRTGLKNFNIRIALYASLFFIFSSYQITYAHEARVYSLMGMLTAMSMYYFLELVNGERRENRFVKTALLLVNILLIYAHYFGFFVLFVQFICILFNKHARKAHSRFWISGSFLILLAYLPNIKVLLERLTNSAGIGGTWLTPPTGLVDLYNMLWKFTNAPVVAALTILLMVSAFIKFILLKRKNQLSPSFQSKLVVTWFLLPFIGMFLISYWTPLFLDRYLMFVSIGFCLFLALIADFMIQKTAWKYMLPALFCLLFIITSRPNLSTKRNVREVVRVLKEMKQEKESLTVFCPHHFSLNIAYYYDRTLFTKIDESDIYKLIDSKMGKESIIGINKITEADFKEKKQLIYLDAAASFSFPGNGILDSLHQNYRLQKEVTVDDFFVIYDFRKAN
jgi:uncharacterized membrane protein